MYFSRSEKAYEFSDSFISVTIPFNKHDAKKEAKSDAKNYLLNLIIELINNNPKISKIELATKTGKSKATIERVLKSTNKIQRIGPKNGGYWKIN